MRETRKQTSLPGAAAKAASRVNLRWFSGLIVLALLLAWWPVRAEGPDDQYANVFNLIQQADSLNTKGQIGPALAKYRDAQKALVDLHTTYPDWNNKLVTFRLTYLAERIAALTQPPPTRTTNAPTTGAGGAPPESRPGETAAPAQAPQVKLLEPGAEPRKELRLHPKPGDKQAFTMTLKMAMAMKAGEMPEQMVKMPPIKLTMDVTVKNVSTQGDITYELVMGEATVSDEAGVMPQVAEAMKSAFAGLKGKSGKGTISNRGLSKGLEFKAPPGADPQLGQMMDEMKQSFADLTVPLPEEAVGPGARWEVKMPLKSQGMTIDETATYKLVSLEGERVTTRSAVSQTAGNQKIQSPAMPGLKVDLTKMTGNGTADVTSDLGQLLPLTGTADLHTERAMGMNAGGQKQSMTMKMDVNVRLEAK